MNPIRLAIHGGAGVIDRAHFSSEREALYRAELLRVVRLGAEMLNAGESAVDVVEATVMALEDCEHFNAGRGSVLNAQGVAEMDASIMDGRDRAAGAVAAVCTPRNPVALARFVMDQSEHVFLAGPNADSFAAAHGIALQTQDYFVLPVRLAQLELARAAGRISLDHDEKYADPLKMGTVGAVARDRAGHLAAATSTGGMTNKIPGRVGDTPVIGAGTWADDQTVAVSATGHGEFFLRTALAHDLHARIAYAGAAAADAAREVLAQVARMGGSGGLIAVDKAGELVLEFNSPGMYRAWVGADAVAKVAIYRE